MTGVNASIPIHLRSARSEPDPVPIVTAIHRRPSDLTPAEAQVARYILDHLEDVPLASLQAVASRSGTSDATV